MKIDISEIATKNVLSEVKAATANEVIGGGGASLDFKFAFSDGGLGAANANAKFGFEAFTIDIDEPEYHQAALQGYLHLGE